MRWKKLFSQRIFFQNGAFDVLKKDYKIFDMHVHTKYSHDSNTPVDSLLKKAESEGYGLAVTDHIKIGGAVEALRQKKVFVIPGIEILAREKKEIILYFYNVKDLISFYDSHMKNSQRITEKPRGTFRRSLTAIRSNLSMAEIVDAANDYACLKCIPHPYAYLTRSSHKFFQRRPDIMKKVDAVEIINSSLRPYMNKNATKFALQNGKAFTAGSDAHMLKEFGRSFVACHANTVEEFLDAIRRKENIIMGEELKARMQLKNILEINKTKRQKEWLSS